MNKEKRPGCSSGSDIRGVVVASVVGFEVVSLIAVLVVVVVVELVVVVDVVVVVSLKPSGLKDIIS